MAEGDLFIAQGGGGKWSLVLEGPSPTSGGRGMTTQAANGIAGCSNHKAEKMDLLALLEERRAARSQGRMWQVAAGTWLTWGASHNVPRAWNQPSGPLDPRTSCGQPPRGPVGADQGTVVPLVQKTVPFCG